jgi:drug/metabolite transporter (DMT)-like permease
VSGTSTPQVEKHAPDDLKTRWTGTALCAASAAGFASLSILGKVALESGLSLTTILSLRFGGAALLLGLFLVFIRRRKIYHGFRLTFTLFLLGAIGYAGQSTLYFSALSRNPASVTSLLLYAYPIFVALLEWLFDRKHPTTQQWGAFGLSALGVVLIIGTAGSSEAQGLDLLGALFVLGSALWYAVYIIMSNRYIHTSGPWVSTMWISLGAGVSFTVMGLSTQTLDLGLGREGYVIILSMIFISTIMALGTLLAGLQLVGPTTASLLSTLEPVFTIILAILLLGESLSGRQFIGGGLILAAVLLLTLPGNRRFLKRPAHN